MQAVLTFLLVLAATMSGACATDPEIEADVCPKFLVEYTDYWTGEYINIFQITGQWQVMEVTEVINLTDPNESSYTAVTLAPTPEHTTGLPMIELDGNNLTIEELEEVFVEEN